MAREDIAVKIAGSCNPTKHPSGFRTGSSPRKLGRAAKQSPLRKEVAKEKDHTKVGSFRLARAADLAASAGGLLDAPSGVAGESQGRGAAR